MKLFVVLGTASVTDSKALYLHAQGLCAAAEPRSMRNRNRIGSVGRALQNQTIQHKQYKTSTPHDPTSFAEALVALGVGS